MVEPRSLRLHLLTSISSKPLDLIREAVLLTSSKIPSCKDLDCCTYKYKYAQVLIITVYRPPKSKYVFLNDFSELLSKVSMDYDCVIISGDFNIQVDNQTDSDGRNFINVSKAFDLSQHVSRPTHNSIIWI